MFNLDEKKVIDFIKQNECKKVLLQLPDGLKKQSDQLVKKLERETGAEILIWFGSNFGSCDLPISVKTLGIDLVVGLGHNIYVKEVSW